MHLPSFIYWTDIFSANRSLGIILLALKYNIKCHIVVFLAYLINSIKELKTNCMSLQCAKILNLINGYIFNLTVSE